MDKEIKKELANSNPLYLRIIWILFSFLAIAAIFGILILSKQVLDIKQQSQVLNDKRELFDNEIKIKKEKIIAIKTEIQKLTPENDNLKTINSSLKSQIIELRRSLETTRSILSNSSNELERIENLLLVNQSQLEEQAFDQGLLSELKKQINSEELQLSELS